MATAHATKIAALGLALFALGACHQRAVAEAPPTPPPAPPVTVDAGAQALTADIAPTPPPRTTDQDVQLGASVRDACRIDDSEKAPKFDYDGAHLSSTDRAVLARISRCVTKGKLRGKTILIVGRGGPTAVGEERAETIREWLVAKGVDPDHVTVTDLEIDEMDSRWKKDRRVDVEVETQAAGKANAAPPAGK